MPLETDKIGGFKFAIENQELQSSAYPGAFSRSIPLWKDTQNVQFTDLGVRKLEGYSAFAVTGNGEEIRGVYQQNEDARFVVYAGDLSKLYWVDVNTGTVQEKGSGFNTQKDAGGSTWDGGATTWDAGATVWDDGLIIAGHWSFRDYGTFMFATNGIDQPQMKTTNGNFASMYQGVVFVGLVSAGAGYAVNDILTLTGGDGTGATARVLSVGGAGDILEVGIEDGGTSYTTPPTGFTGGTGTGASLSFRITDLDVQSIEIFVVRGPHILGFNTSLNDREFIWCDADDPYTWLTAPNNLAGALTIRELESPIRAAVSLGSRIAVYGDDQMFLVNYLGNELVFGYQPAINGVGAVSKKAVVAVGPRNFGLSRQGFFATDGAGFQYIDQPIRYWFRNNIAQSQISKCAAFHDEKNNNVRWYFPTDNISANVGVSFNYEKNIWTLLTTDKTAGQERIIQNFPISGDSAGNLYRENQGETANGLPLTCFLRTKPLDLQSADLVKELDSLRVGVVGAGLQWRVGWSETENGTISWEPYFAVDDGFEFANLRTAGRWLSLEFYSNTSDASWEMFSAEIIGRIEGTR